MKKPIEAEIAYFRNFVTDEKNALFDRLIEERSDYVTVVLEDLYQSHNQSAVMRTLDCAGVQDVYLIENRNSYDDTSTVSRGARAWLNLHRFNSHANNTGIALKRLREKGYRIIATSPHYSGYTPDTLPLEAGKMAFCFGTEMTGLSREILDSADGFIRVPMYGFTESLNVSVCAALIVYNVMERLRKSAVDWHLTEERKKEVLWDWYAHTIKSFEDIVRRFRADIKNTN